MGKRSRLLEIVPNFLLFFLFACCMFFVLISGAKSYKNVTAVMEEQFSVNTCISYVTAKVRHYDIEGAVTIGEIGDTDALLLKEKIKGEEYLTYLYCYDGSLMELFCSADMEVLPIDGQQIMDLDFLDLSAEEDVVHFSCEINGKQAETSVYLQSGKGESE
jgi:hypothetical protein